MKHENGSEVKQAIRLSFSQIKDLAVDAIENREPMGIIGAPGIGKSALSLELGTATKREPIVITCVLKDPVFSNGLPFKISVNGKEFAESLPFVELEKFLESTTKNQKKKYLVVLEDFGQATKMTQASFMSWIGERTIGVHRSVTSSLASVCRAITAITWPFLLSKSKPVGTDCAAVLNRHGRHGNFRRPPDWSMAIGVAQKKG